MDFNLSIGEKVKTSFMYLSGKEDNFRYTETEILQVLELPYEGDELVMLIFLPKAGSLKATEDALTFTKNNELKTGLVKEKVEVYLPKFKFANKYFMTKDLKQMGMPLAFSDAADFSGITGRKDLYISDVIHQAFIDVNEEGTEAAAATAVVMARAMFKPAEPKIFKADRPFIFLIEEKTTGNILFIGRVSDPTT